MVVFIIVIVPACVMEANRVKVEYGWAWAILLGPIFLVVLHYAITWGGEFVVKSDDPPTSNRW